MTTPTAEAVKLRFKQIKDKTMEKQARVQRAVFFELSRRVINKTPVQYGRARGGWNADVDTYSPASKDFNGSAGEAAAHAMASVEAAIAKHTSGQDLCLANGVSYIRYLNDGSSKQAPAGMTDEAINELSNVVTVTARREL